MGNNSTTAKQQSSQHADGQSEKRYTLQDLPETFKKHYDQVIVFKHATSAQDMLVDKLSDTFSKSVDKTMKKEADILKEIQSARNPQCELLYNSLMELYCNMNCILEDNTWPTIDVYSNNQQNTPENKDTKHSLQVYSSENKTLKETVRKLEKTIQLLQTQTKSLQQELSKLRPPEGMGTVQLFHSHDGNTIMEIEADLKEKLKMHLNQVKLIKCHKLDDVDPSKALVIISIITSRVGTDATNAIQGIKNPANTALVLIHIKEDHALSRQTSSTILTGDIFKALGGIFDMAFMHGKGIYQCEMNDAALEGVHSFIKQNLECTNV